MDLMCVEFMLEDLWLGSLGVTCTPTLDLDAEPMATGSRSVSPSPLQDLR